MKIKYLVCSVALNFAVVTINAQQPPTGPAVSPFSPPPVLEQNAWYRGGNLAGAGGASKNLFGTLFNSPIYTQTNGVFREKLNGDFFASTQYTINGYTFANGVNTSGYLLLGQDNQTQPGGGSALLYNAKGAFSLLHLNGPQTPVPGTGPGTGFTQELGYRPWMKTGITFTGNNDMMYFGLRALPSAPSDQTEMVVSWADNSAGGAGPDDFAFRFISLGATSTKAIMKNSVYPCLHG